MMTSQTPHDACPKVVINRAKFNVCTFSSFGGLKAYERIDRITPHKLFEPIKAKKLSIV